MPSEVPHALWFKMPPAVVSKGLWPTSNTHPLTTGTVINTHFWMTDGYALTEFEIEVLKTCLQVAATNLTVPPEVEDGCY